MTALLKRRLIGLFVICLSICHAGLIVFYVVCNTEKPWTIYDSAIGNFAKSYAGVFFKQNWHLFSPVPATQEFRFLVRYKQVDEDWGDWQWDQGDTLRDHHLYRVTTSGKLLYVFGRFHDALFNGYKTKFEAHREAGGTIDAVVVAKIGDEILASPDGKNALRYAIDHFKGPRANLEGLQLMVRIVDPLDYTEYESGQTETRTVRDVPFPIVWMKDLASEGES
ncbi:MAG: hypothetical protein VX589_01285 [Myxococcota bacterium]|nr:hypothetical protein [Myxococcota bacterium]